MGEKNSVYFDILLYCRLAYGATESQNWRPIEKCLIFRNFRRKLS